MVVPYVVVDGNAEDRLTAIRNGGTATAAGHMYFTAAFPDGQVLRNNNVSGIDSEVFQQDLEIFGRPARNKTPSCWPHLFAKPERRFPVQAANVQHPVPCFWFYEAEKPVRLDTEGCEKCVCS